MEWYKIIGWLGALLFIAAYVLLTLKKISAAKPFYHILNILGAVCLIINASKINDFPNILVNSIWTIIGLYALLQFFFIRK